MRWPWKKQMDKHLGNHIKDKAKDKISRRSEKEEVAARIERVSRRVRALKAQVEREQEGL